MSKVHSNAQRKYWQSLSEKERIIRKEALRESQRKVHLGRKQSDEAKKKIAISVKANWDSMSQMEKAKRLSKILEISSSSIEEKVKRELSKHGIRFVQQKSLYGGMFYVDFWLPEYKLVIECNGDYWHSQESKIDRDRRLEEYILSKGKDILWLWEHEINDEWFDISDYLEVI